QLMNCGAVADEKTDVPNCITIEHKGDVEKQTAFKNVNITICSKSSQLAAIAAGAASGDMVLDVCAAPGGKTIIMAQGMENSGAIIACDVSENKLSVIRKTAVRCGIKNIKTQCKDAREFDPTFEERFNVVLADVPCSGLGMIGRKPEIRYKDEEEIKGLPEIQMAILKNVAKYVIPGGVLVYSTCTILPRENEDIVNAFLAENKDFEACSFELPGIGAVPRDITLLPQLHGTDGFYMCKLRRKT
ncbi:MAG: methyltransferase domain-containing protein, partial [Clostridia bacterium]